MTDDQIPNPFPNAARRAGAKLTPIATAVEQFDRALAKPIAKFTAAVDALPPPARTIAVGESIRPRPRIGDELGPTAPDTDVQDMTDDLLRRSAHRLLVIELDDARATMLSQAERVWELEAQVTELRSRDMSIVGAVVRKLLRGGR